MPTDVALNKFIDDLKLQGFEGDIESSYAERIVAATDNSIYQVTPLAIFYPRVTQDINRVMSCVVKHRHEGFTLCARGGGTGTNGQSLTDSLIVDCSRHLNQIIDFDPQQQTITVQPGVVLDQLNDFLQPHGLFFPIDISSSSRATLGGMVATDASGKGSLIYGKTSNHIVSIDLVLANGSDYRMSALSLEQMDLDSEVVTEKLLPIYHKIDQHHDEINRVFPKMNRGLTGYNLQQSITEEGRFNPCYLIAGSEGTLAITRQIKLRVISHPAHKMLTVIFYEDFQRGLEHVQSLLKSKPSAIEILDDKILNLAHNDSVWFDVQSVLGDLPDKNPIKAANFVEHVGHSEQEMEDHQQRIRQILKDSSQDYRIILSKTIINPDQITALWNLRKRAVGLLGDLQDNKRGIAFVEDTAVPPQNLAAYISDFRQLLDDCHLQYGMYGHADAGVLHVRPALNLMQAKDRKLIRRISDKIARLVKQHGGVLWGEHGRGFRGEYTPIFFGDVLYSVLCDIKSIFDPYNLLNPGKLTTPQPNQQVIALDEITFRGELDAQINPSDQQKYRGTLSCNGNGACYSWQLDEAMCPSYKATRNKLYSPKGRAAMLREWIRLKNTDTSSSQFINLELSLFDSLQCCLSCSSCASSCPLKVDIPELKSFFLETWYESRPRSFSSLFNRHFETLIAMARHASLSSNALIQNKFGARLLQGISGLNRLPKFSQQRLTIAIVINRKNIDQLRTNKKAVIILRDNYMQSFDQQTLQASYDVFQKLGYQVYLSKVIHNGKLLHVKGYRKEFKQQAKKVLKHIIALSETGLPLISIETVTRLMFDMEYPDILQQKNTIKLHSIESFLLTILQQNTKTPEVKKHHPVTLLPHCMEQTSAKESSQNWKAVFEKLGIPLMVINAGCCGMSGLFGHEAQNNQISDDIFNLFWKPTLDSTQGVLLASGFSCRCQSKNHRLDTLHPIVHLAEMLKN